MEMLKAKIHENNMNGNILNCLATATRMHSDGGGSCSSPSPSQMSWSVHGDDVTAAPIVLTTSGPAETGDTKRLSAFSHHGHGARFEYTHPSVAIFCILNAASNEFQLLSDVAEDEETQASSIGHVESFSLWQDPDCDDDNSSGMVIGDMDDVDEIRIEHFEVDPKDFTRTEKEFLAALDWTKLASIIV